MKIVFCFVLLKIFSLAKSAKILAVFPSPGYSQFIQGEKLMTELVRRGHEVTVISPFKPREDIKDYRTILVQEIAELFQGVPYQEHDKYLFSSIITVGKLVWWITDFILAHKNVQQLIHSNETFDLAIVEQLGNEAHMAFATYFNVPLISYSSTALSEFNSHLVGNVRLPSVNPLLLSPYTDRMTFPERLHNTLMTWFDLALKELVTFPFYQQLLTKYFPKEMKLRDIMHNASILLMNTHPSTICPFSLTPSVVEIGGFHISSKELPSNIQKYLDEANEGAIFFSMGTNIRSSDLPKEKLEMILNVFSKLKQRVLWKFESSDIQNKPKNVLISKWFPQSDILAHPNVIAFITHGGILSITEAVYHGVPMIGIPIFFDQKMNVAQSVQKKRAILLPFKDLSEESLTAALNEIITNPEYSKNAKKFSSILKDQVVKPLDLAVFWIEFVIRHGGTPSMRNAAIDLYWFQFYLVDVLCFIILCIGILYYVIKTFISRIFRKIVRTTLVNKNNKQKMN